MNVRRLLAAACCVPLLALVACSDDEPQAGSDDPASSSSPSPSPTETGPTIPPAAQGTGEASAKAFVRHWFAVFSNAMNDGETAGLTALSSPGCQSCSAFVDVIETTYEDGGHIESAGWTPVAFTRLKAGEMAFDFVVRTGAEKFFKEDGSIARRAPAGTQDMTVELVRDDYVWRIDRLAVLNG